MAIKFKRTLLLALAKQDFLPNNPAKRDELLERFKKHIMPTEEAEWYGLTFAEAFEKFKRETTPAPEPIVPLKYKFREEFIQNLRELSQKQEKPAKSWSSWNPFSSWKCEKRNNML